MNPIFETKKINMETLPEYLKSAREGFSYDIKQVAKITNISDKFIIALEQGAYHKLPADVYVRGFLKKLAELYMADHELLTEQYKKERGIHENITRRKTAYKEYAPHKFVVTPKSMAFALMAFFILFILGYLFYQIRSINQPPRIAILQPKDGDVIQTSSVVVQGQTDPGTNLNINGQAVAVDAYGNFKQLISLSPGRKELDFTAQSNFGKINTKKIFIIADIPNQDNLASTASQTAPITLTVSVRSKPTWLIIQVDNQPSDNVNIAAAGSKTYTAQKQILISTGDAGNTYVEMNGKDLGKLGRDGEVLQNVPFTLDSLNQGN